VGIWWKYIKPSKMKRWVHEGVNKATTPSKMKMWVQGAGRLRPGEKRKTKSPKVFSNIETPLSSSGTTDFVGLL
jgi:hypothetical protein